METLYRERSSADDLFEYDGSTGQGHYSPLETLVRQTSLKGGWRVKGAQKIRTDEHPPSSMTSQVPSREQTTGTFSRRAQDDYHLAPERPATHNLFPPASPLLHAQFRQSTATSADDGQRDSSYTTTTTFDQSISSPPPVRKPAFPPRLTIDDESIDRLREDQWDSSSDMDSPYAVDTQGVLPPSFSFRDIDTQGSSMSGGRPLSDRSMVIPPSVKGLSLKSKSRGLNSPSRGLDSPTVPNSPAGMSFYSESAYSVSSSSKAPPNPSASFVPSITPSPPIARPQLPQQPRPFSDASEESIYDDDIAGRLVNGDEDAVDFANAFERSTTGQWKSRQSDLDPFAFRQYEGKPASSQVSRTSHESSRPSPQPPPPDPLDSTPRLSRPTSPPVTSSAPDIVVTSDRSRSRSSEDTHASIYQSITYTTLNDTTYSYPDPPTTMPVSQSLPAELHPITPLLNSPGNSANANRAPSLVSAKVGGRFNFSRPLRMIPTSPSEPVSSHYIDSGWSNIGESSSSEIAEQSPPSQLMEKRPTLAQQSMYPSSSHSQPNLGSFRGQEHRDPSAMNASDKKAFLAPGLRSDADSFRDSGSSSDSLYALEQKFPAPPSAANSAFSLPLGVSTEKILTPSGGTLGDRRPSANTMAGSSTNLYTASPSTGVIDRRDISTPTAPIVASNVRPQVEIDTAFISPRAAPSPPSSSDHHYPQTPHNNQPHITTVLYSSPGAAKSQPNFSSSPRIEDHPMPRDKGYGSLNAQNRGGPISAYPQDTYTSPYSTSTATITQPNFSSPRSQERLGGQGSSPYAIPPSRSPSQRGQDRSIPAGAISQPNVSSPRSEERLGHPGKGYGQLSPQGAPRTPEMRHQGSRELLSPGGMPSKGGRSPPSPSPAARQVTAPAAVTLGLTPNGRGDGSGSRLSLYSNYSYYNLPESPGPSSGAASPIQDHNAPGSRHPSGRSGQPSPGPNGPSPMNPAGRNLSISLSPAQLTPEGLYQPQYTTLEQPQSRSLFRRNKSNRSASTGSPAPSNTLSTYSQNQSRNLLPQASSAEEYLQMGITHHEADQLALSAHCFEQSATLGGGCGFGMLMWGLTLRHGWGVKRDEKAGFAWMKQAADAAVGNLEDAMEGADADAVKMELVLAIFEVGQCYSKGWGVKEDKKMAFSYFQVAARLGDADAQQELGFCFANGRGTKKDKKMAAKWYRAAAAQGVSTVGLAWIFKDKYNETSR